MLAESSTTRRKKRKFEDVSHLDRRTQGPSKLAGSSEKDAGKLEAAFADETIDLYPTILPTLIQPAAAEKKLNLRARSNLCRHCAKIDLDTLLSRPHKSYAGEPGKKLNPIRQWDIESCPFCSLLYSTGNSSIWKARIPIKSFSSNKMQDRTWRSISTNMLQVGYSSRYIVSQPEGIAGPVKVIKKLIESFDIVKTWISFCQRHHTKLCSMEDQSSVPGLKLINCQTLTIVPGEDHLYVALSYVWGYSSEMSSDPDKLPENLPNTIKDAINVTKRLGYLYIWIDRYCINQENEEETAHQLGKMDLIYQNAVVTIIAAVGDDPGHGLPGVDIREREAKHLTTCAKVGSYFLISTDGWPKGAIEGTKRETRAWTYQEALLSRRRLVFSEKEMFFECYGMYCCESLGFPLEKLHRKDMQGFKSVFCPQKRVGVFPRGVGTAAIDIIRRIEEYSNLNLTNPSDILKGMLGIFNAFQRNRLYIQHLAGIPILPSISGYLKKPIKGWTSSMGFFAGLCWGWNIRSERRSERRHDFPSWSWTGWYGPVKWKIHGSQAWPFINIDPSVDIKVKLIDGRILTLESFQALQSHSSLYTQLSNTIHITTWTTEVKILTSRLMSQEYWCEASVPLEDGGHLKWSFGSAPKVRLIRGNLYKGIILGFDSWWGDPAGPTILICTKVGDALERIGLADVNRTVWRRYDKNGVGEWEMSEERCSVEQAGILSSGQSLSTPQFEKPPVLVRVWEEVQLG